MQMTTTAFSPGTPAGRGETQTGNRITPLKDALAKVESGWSARQYITSRAVEIRRLCQEGQRSLAVGLGNEIDALQHAEILRSGGPGLRRTRLQVNLSHWAETCIHGWLCSRYLIATTPDEARAEWMRLRGPLLDGIFWIEGAEVLR